jgi:DNA-binding XRE family transcriptional regulator
MDLKEYLKQTKTTQMAFALKLHVYPHTVGRFVLKKASPKLSLAVKIVELTEGQVTCKELLCKKDLEELEALEERWTEKN